MRYAQCLGIQLSVSDILLRQKRNWVIETFTFDEGYNGPYPLYLGRVSADRDKHLNVKMEDHCKNC